LSYSFQPGTIRDKFGRRNRLVVFSPAISKKAKVHIRTRIREVLKPRWTTQTPEWFAKELNFKIKRLDQLLYKVQQE
jgi:hypothetical protein